MAIRAGNSRLSTAASADFNPLLTIHAANSAYLSGVPPEATGGEPRWRSTILPMLSALRTKMQWHQERQRVLAENISNSDTPNFRPRDLVEPKFDQNGASAGARWARWR